MKFLALLVTLFGMNLISNATAQEPIRLWPGDAPGALGTADKDVPTLTPYLPAPEKATGAAIVVCPGGGYGGLAPHEGKDYALWLNELGIAGYVLKYRLGPGGYKHPSMLNDAARAVRFVRSHAAELGVDPATLDRRIHVHVPAGAVPKDGPSAGVTMVTALVSMATGRQVRADVGMTGEVTLNGRVLPIGGVKQKLLAAQRAGLSTVFIPQRNEPDLDDVPAEVLEALDVKPMTDVAEIVAQALESASQAVTAAA